MLVCGSQLRFTARENRQLSALTGSDPSYITRASELRNYVRAQYSMYPGRNAIENFLRARLEACVQEYCKLSGHSLDIADENRKSAC